MDQAEVVQVEMYHLGMNIKRAEGFLLKQLFLHDDFSNHDFTWNFIE